MVSVGNKIGATAFSYRWAQYSPAQPNILMVVLPEEARRSPCDGLLLYGPNSRGNAVFFGAQPDQKKARAARSGLLYAN